MTSNQKKGNGFESIVSSKRDPKEKRSTQLSCLQRAPRPMHIEFTRQPGYLQRLECKRGPLMGTRVLPVSVVLSSFLCGTAGATSRPRILMEDTVLTEDHYHGASVIEQNNIIVTCAGYTIEGDAQFISTCI